MQFCGQRMVRLMAGWAVIFIGCCLSVSAAENRLSFERLDDGRISVRADGNLFAQYHPDFMGTPIIWPVLSSAGTLMTRSNPMIDSCDIAGESDPELKNIYRNAETAKPAEMVDHPHQRSIWFTHGAVSGADFWAVEKKTTIRSEAVDCRQTADDTVVLTLHDIWSDDAKNRQLCEDTRTITFGILPEKEIRFIDYDVDITALDDIVFEDTKEGTFGVRTAGTLDGDAVKRNPAWGGKILNAEGLTGDDAWAKRSGWVSYYGVLPKRLSDAELDQQSGEKPESFPLTTGGIVVMNHPKSFRYPSWYHVRAYGLFAVNPFGIRDFEPALKLDGSTKLAKGEKLTFRYRILLFDGELSAEETARQFDAYRQKP